MLIEANRHINKREYVATATIILSDVDDLLLSLTHVDTFACSQFQERVFPKENKAPVACCLDLNNNVNSDSC